MHKLLGKILLLVGLYCFTKTYAQVVPTVIPQQNEIVYFRNIQLVWPIKYGQSRIQLTTDKNFSHNILDTIVSGHQLVLDVMKPNHNYYWRYNLNALQNSWSRPLTFKTTNIIIESDDDNDEFPAKLITTFIDEKPLLVIDNPEQKILDIEIYNGSGKLVARQRSDAGYKGLDLASLCTNKKFEVNIIIGGQVMCSKVKLSDEP